MNVRGPSGAPYRQASEEAIRDFGYRLGGNVTGLNSIEAVLPQVRARQRDALALEGGPGLIVNAGRVAEFAIRERMPATYGLRETTSAGLLFSYGVSLVAKCRSNNR